MEPYGAISLALSKYNFGAPDIRIVISHLLGIALSRRSIRLLVKSGGNGLKHGRPPGTLKINKDDLFRLIELTSGGLESFSGNTLHLLDHIKVQFGLSPRQYLDWVARFVRGGVTFCGDVFYAGIFSHPFSPGRGTVGSAEAIDNDY